MGISGRHVRAYAPLGCDRACSGNHIAISLIGGKGVEAQNNAVSVSEVFATLLAGNGQMISVVDNMEGATGNSVYPP